MNSQSLAFLRFVERFKDELKLVLAQIKPVILAQNTNNMSKKKSKMKLYAKNKSYFEPNIKLNASRLRTLIKKSKSFEMVGVKRMVGMKKCRGKSCSCKVEIKKDCGGVKYRKIQEKIHYFPLDYCRNDFADKNIFHENNGSYRMHSQKIFFENNDNTFSASQSPKQFKFETNLLSKL